MQPPAASSETPSRRSGPRVLILAETERESAGIARLVEQSPSAPHPVSVTVAPGDCGAAARWAQGADAALIATDAERGMTQNVRRHILIAALLGVPHVALVVQDRATSNLDAGAIQSMTRMLDALPLPPGVLTRAVVPLASDALLGHLTGLTPRTAKSDPLRMLLKAVSARGEASPALTGAIARGRLAAGDEIILTRAGHSASVVRITDDAGSPLEYAGTGQTATLTLDRDVGAAPGDIFAGLQHRPDVADQFAAHLVWTSAEPMLPGRQYMLELAGKSGLASITDLKHAIDLADLGRIPAKVLSSGDVGLCNFSLAEPIAFDPCAECPATGAFTLFDRDTHAVVGTGMIQFALRRATNIQIQRIEIDKAARAGLKDQQPVVLWFTGLSGAGKTTIANRVESRLAALGRHTYLMDGDNLRHGLNRDLGFLAADRVENMRRVGEVAKLMLDAGLIVLVSLISPFRSERQMVRELLGPGEFVEIFVDASIATCRQRDPKGLYKKADEGKIANFTGVSSPYEAPIMPDVRLASDSAAPDALADQVLAFLAARKP